jgi:hypothetical protein
MARPQGVKETTPRRLKRFVARWEPWHKVNRLHGCWIVFDRDTNRTVASCMNDPERNENDARAIADALNILDPRNSPVRRAPVNVERLR